jgi:pimeloyl-ACP methyl ester carboxylesterase
LASREIVSAGQKSVMHLMFLAGSSRVRRSLAGVAAMAAAALLFGSCAARASPARSEPPGPKPTIVLEHGAFADGSSWNGVIERLTKAGYPVVAAANPLRGVASDAAALRSVVEHVAGPVVLVAHSYGGSVISTAAVNEPRVKALVYIAAFMPDAGENALDLTGKFPGSTLSETLEKVRYTLPGGAAGTDLYISPGKFPRQFAADVPAGTATLMAATQRPVAEAALEEKATDAAWKTTPSWALVTTQDLNIPPDAQRFMAERAHAHTTEVESSHAVSVSHPDVVTRVIEEAATTVPAG